jgi:hypothetical protein
VRGEEMSYRGWERLIRAMGGCKGAQGADDPEVIIDSKKQSNCFRIGGRKSNKEPSRRTQKVDKYFCPVNGFWYAFFHVLWRPVCCSFFFATANRLLPFVPSFSAEVTAPFRAFC